LLLAQGITLGCLFSKKPTRQTLLLDYEDEFYKLIEEVHATRPDLIGGDVDVREEYGTW
jgi:hypothetical protein